MTGVDEDFASAAGIPEVDCAIIAGGGDTRAVGRESGGVDLIAVAVVDEQVAPVVGIPDVRGSVLTDRDKVVAVRRPGDRFDSGAVAAIDEDGTPATHIPEARRAIVAAEASTWPSGDHASALMGSVWPLQEGYRLAFRPWLLESCHI